MRDLQTRLYRIAGKYFGAIVLCLALAVSVPANGKTPPGKGTGKPPGRGAGKTLAVTTNVDDVNNKHTLRYAVANAKDGDTIQLTAAVKGPIVLKYGELVVNKNVTILSVPARIPTISGEDSSRIFMIAEGATVTMQRLNLVTGNGTGNDTDYDGSGGAILNFGTLNFIKCSISGSYATSYGGAIANFATLSITYSTLTGNFASNGGGGIYNKDGSLTVSNSTISNNESNNGDPDNSISDTSTGGGILNDTGSNATVSAGSISNNMANNGGGIYNNGISLTVTNCIFSDNTATNKGGGIYDNIGTLSESNNIFDGNSPDGIYP